MNYKAPVGRLKPKKQSSFGKKPFKGKNKNIAGRKKASVLHPERPVRMPKKEVEARILFIQGLGPCQICEESHNLDMPHHVVQGLGVKDDRYMLNVCIGCHKIIHSVSGYSTFPKTREEYRAIAWNNHLAYNLENGIVDDATNF